MNLLLLHTAQADGVQPEATMLRAVVGADSSVKVSQADGGVRVESPLVTLNAPKADVSREGRVLTVRIRP